jgi:hypothetical protein
VFCFRQNIVNKWVTGKIFFPNGLALVPWPGLSFYFSAGSILANLEKLKRQLLGEIVSRGRAYFCVVWGWMTAF